MRNTLVNWFGNDFKQLHPALQQLHTRGGSLAGTVTIQTGKSWFSKWLGLKLARKMGVPTDQRHPHLVVTISHEPDGMHWCRNFSGKPMKSIFLPIGEKANDGYIVESTGLLKAKLTVDVIEGGWVWRPLKMLIGKVPLPLWLFPKSHAYKRVNQQGNYEFSVAFTMPFLGTLLAYSGELKLT